MVPNRAETKQHLLIMAHLAEGGLCGRGTFAEQANRWSLELPRSGLVQSINLRFTWNLPVGPWRLALGCTINSSQMKSRRENRGTG